MQDVYNYYYNGPSFARGKCHVLYVDQDGTTQVRFKRCPTDTYWVESSSILPLSYLTPYKPPSDMILPTDAQERKKIPIVTGVLDYFPLAIAEVAKCSLESNEQHNPWQELHWDRTKSTDHIDCLGRHLIDRGKFDTDGQRHSAKMAWRALANLEIELEEAKKKGN